MLHFRLRHTPRANRSIDPGRFFFDLSTNQLSADVMHLAASILRGDPESNEIDLFLDGIPITPNVLSDSRFREFASLLYIALPSWPILLVRQSPITPLLVLAALPNISIFHHPHTDSWEVSVSRRDLEWRLLTLASNLGRSFTREERTKMLFGLVEDLQD